MKIYNKHLTLDQHILIEKGLNESQNFVTIGKLTGKDPSTISKEVRKHRTIKRWRDPNKMPGCSHWKTCQKKNIYPDCYSFKDCRDCAKCKLNSPDYTPKIRGKLEKPP